MDIQKLLSLCDNKTVWIQTHNFPDPDAIASAYGLQQLFAHYGYASRLCHEGEIDKISARKMLNLLDIEMYSYDEIIDEMKESDPIILVDCQKNSGNTTDLIGDEVAVIDHHPTYVKIEYKYEDLRITGSCSSIIAEYYKELGIEPSTRVATALLYGMRMDTMQLTRGVTQFDVDMFSYIFKYSSHKTLKRLERNELSFSDIQAYGVAINNIKIYGTLGFSHLDFICPDALVAILSDFLLSLSDVDVVVLYAKRKDGYKFSVRSELKEVHAGTLANKCLKKWGNGGGHGTMAGGFAAAEKIDVPEENFYSAVQEHFLEIIKKLYPQILEE